MRSDFRKVRSLRVKGPCAGSPPFSFVSLGFFSLDFIQPDGGFQHQHHVEALLRDFANHACNLVESLTDS